MKSNWKRISALVLSLALLLCAAVPAMAESAAKDETVYILSDAQGQARRIIVSDWLKNPDKLDELTDATRLQNLTVVEGNATFERDGERLTWDADGKDVYYQGDSDEELPLTLQITYLVDGEEVPAAHMAGKKGNGKLSGLIHHNHSRISQLIFQVWSNQPHRNPGCPNKDQPITCGKLLPGPL